MTVPTCAILQIGKQGIHVQLFKKSFPSLLPLLKKQYRQAMRMYSQLALAGDSPKPRKRQRRQRSKAAKLRIASTASVHTLCGSAAPAAAVMKNYHHNLTLKMKHCAAWKVVSKCALPGTGEAPWKCVLPPKHDACWNKTFWPFSFVHIRHILLIFLFSLCIINIENH